MAAGAVSGLEVLIRVRTAHTGHEFRTWSATSSCTSAWPDEGVGQRRLHFTYQAPHCAHVAVIHDSLPGCPQPHTGIRNLTLFTKHPIEGVRQDTAQGDSSSCTSHGDAPAGVASGAGRFWRGRQQRRRGRRGLALQPAPPQVQPPAARVHPCAPTLCFSLRSSIIRIDYSVSVAP